MSADGKTVISVAHRCGWSSTSPFVDVFRRAYGYTPVLTFGPNERDSCNSI